MELSKQFCFTHPGGEDIYLFTLRNTKGTEITITNYGVIITAFKLLNADGTFNDIVLGFDNVEEYLATGYLQRYCWFGSAVGRYANRIKNATFNLDGEKIILTKNNNNDQLHGGISGFDKKVWQHVSSGESPRSFLELKYSSVDGEEGFPGNLETIIRYELNDANELSYEYKATCDKPTAVNLTHHSYFNLDNGKGTIKDYEVKIYASRFLEQDDDLVATGVITAVANTVFDFRDFHRIEEEGRKIEIYDRSFVAEKRADQLVAEARSVRSNLRLQVYSTEPIVHFYTGRWIPEIKGKNGSQYGPFSGLCLETHKHPNAVNIPHFPDTILRPGNAYYQKTIYKLIV